MNKHPVLIGVPVDSSGKSGGCEHGPRILRQYGLAGAIRAKSDLGDLPVKITGTRDPNTGVVGFESVLQLTATVRSQVRSVLEHGDLPFLLGGCCSFAMGAIAGARDAFGRVGIAYIDGHLDLYDGKTSPTGDCADMPMAFLLGLAPEPLGEAMGTRFPVTPLDVAMVGFRDRNDAKSKGSVMPEDVSRNLFLADDHAVIESSPRMVGENVRQRMKGASGRFWLHLDFDVLNDQVFPAVDYTSPGGLNWAQLQQLLAPLVHSDGLIGMSLACYNPDLDSEDRCAQDSVAALRELFG